MSAELLDRDGKATIAAAEAEAALARGDTPLARRRYAEAGELLERESLSTVKVEDQNLIRFLAATQFYKGGRYRESLELANQIKKDHLPEGVRRLLPKFIRDVQDRASSDYRTRIQTRLAALWKAGDHAGILQAFQEHPYVLKPKSMAFLRAAACESLGKYRAAAMFYADAIRWSSDEQHIITAAIAFPLSLPHEGKLEEAWEYVRHQIELIPHAATYLVASWICFQQATARDGEASNRFLELQLDYFREARDRFARLPENQQAEVELRKLMTLGFNAAVFGLRDLGKLQEAKELCADAIAFEPGLPGSWTTRGILTYPDTAAVTDFQQAVELGDNSHFPYFYLAHHALIHGDFSSAHRLAGEALQRERGNDAQSRSYLYSWQAICRASLGADRNEVETIFQQATASDPTNEEAEENYRLYVNSLATAGDNLSIPWRRGRVGVTAVSILLDHKLRCSKEFNDRRTGHLESQVGAA